MENTESDFKCSVCNESYEVMFFCDETMLCYCGEHFEDVHCEELHGEGCATTVWQ